MWVQGLLLPVCATHASDPGPRWTCFAQILSPAVLPLIPLSSGAPATAPPAQQMISSPTPPHAARLPAFVMWRRSEFGCRGGCLRLCPERLPSWFAWQAPSATSLAHLLSASTGARAAAPPAQRTSSCPAPQCAGPLLGTVMWRRSEGGHGRGGWPLAPAQVVYTSRKGDCISTCPYQSCYPAVCHPQLHGKWRSLPC